jgi:predicted RNase H-like nuclease (RuvC/YqgF family)
MGAVVNEKVKDLKEKIDALLKLYRQKHDELELAEEEWDIGEIQVALEDYTKEIKILKDKVREFEHEHE